MARKSVWPGRWTLRRAARNDMSSSLHHPARPAMSPTVTAIATFLLVASSIGGLLLAVFLPQLSGGNRMQRRREVALGLSDGAPQPGARPDGDKPTGEGRPMRRSVEETLRDIERKQRAQARGRARTSLGSRLRQAGLTMSPRVYFGICVGLGMITAVTFWSLLGLAPPVSAALGLAAGLWLPNAWVKSRIKRRQQAFTAAFPDAVDIIVRGIRTGIPLTDCLRIVATESRDPVRGELRTTVEDLSMGLTVEEAVQRMSERVMLEESRFFAIVITIQSRTGGNLSEALGNLSVVLRDRAKMRGKIRAMSSEAKASAGIIGSLPPLVCFLVFLTSPGYVGLLFSTVAGNAVLAGSGLWMLCGILIMRKMINFDF